MPTHTPTPAAAPVEAANSSLPSRPLHIAIAGNIGAGKTTLSSRLAQHFGWEVHFEDAENNPYLSDFYQDMLRWSFNLQVYFLNSRYRQVVDIQRGTRSTVQDRSIYEDAYIFAPNLYEMHLMAKRDYDNYLSLFELMQEQVNPPDLVIYLRANLDTLRAHIRTRGRDYENSIDMDYLRSLNERYNKWADSYTAGELLVIDIDDIDYENNPDHLADILARVQAKLPAAAALLTPA